MSNYGLAGESARVTPQVAQEQLDERCNDDKIHYVVEITGHDAPFQWTVERRMPGGRPDVKPNGDCAGVSDSYEGALLDASVVAHQAEWDRRHKTTIRTEELFSVDA